MCAFEIDVSEYDGGNLVAPQGSPEGEDGDVVLLWDKDYRAWWRRDAQGYTDDVNQAGKFSRRVAGRFYDPEIVYPIPARVAYGIVAETLKRVYAQIATSARNAEAKLEGVGNP